MHGMPTLTNAQLFDPRCAAAEDARAEAEAYRSVCEALRTPAGDNAPPKLRTVDTALFRGGVAYTWLSEKRGMQGLDWPAVVQRLLRAAPRSGFAAVARIETQKCLKALPLSRSELSALSKAPEGLVSLQAAPRAGKGRNSLPRKFAHTVVAAPRNFADFATALANGEAPAAANADLRSLSHVSKDGFESGFEDGAAAASAAVCAILLHEASVRGGAVRGSLTAEFAVDDAGGVTLLHVRNIGPPLADALRGVIGPRRGRASDAPDAETDDCSVVPSRALTVVSDDDADDNGGRELALAAPAGAGARALAWVSTRHDVTAVLRRGRADSPAAAREAVERRIVQDASSPPKRAGRGPTVSQVALRLRGAALLAQLEAVGGAPHPLRDRPAAAAAPDVSAEDRVRRLGNLCAPKARSRANDFGAPEGHAPAPTALAEAAAHDNRRRRRKRPARPPPPSENAAETAAVESPERAPHGESTLILWVFAWCGPGRAAPTRDAPRRTRRAAGLGGRGARRACRAARFGRAALCGAGRGPRVPHPRVPHRGRLWVCRGAPSAAAAAAANRLRRRLRRRRILRHFRRPEPIHTAVSSGKQSGQLGAATRIMPLIDGRRR